MAINVFEGARRLAKLAALLGAVAYCGGIAYDFRHPDVIVVYQIKRPGIAPVRVESGCDGDILTEHRSYVPTSRGGPVSVTLCFQKEEFSDGRKLIPYKFDLATKKLWGDESHSSEVTEYTRRTINAFKIPAADEDWIDRLRWSKRWERARNAAIENIFPLLGWLAFLWLFSWAVGWIVRGFMGIPRGSDRRPPER